MPYVDYLKNWQVWTPAKKKEFKSDRTDLQMVHLDGLSFSRSWCMKGIASQLPSRDNRKKLLLHAAIKHLNASLPQVATESYGGKH